jgi:subtilisin family serine protease
MSRHLPVPMRGALAVLTAASALVLAAPGTAFAANGWELTALSVPAANKISKGDGVTVAVIDTGVRIGHPALKGRASDGPDFLKETDQSESWYGIHGTSMASSVLDVAPAAKVLGLRAIRDDEDPDYKDWVGQLANPDVLGGHAVIDAIRYAADSGAKVISMSLGSDTPFGAYQDDEARSIEYALSKGVVVIAALGNEGDEENPVAYPAAYPGVIAVAATNQDGSRAKFSSVHSYADVAAPGVGINAANATTNGRKPVNGTSSATALTAGVVALIVAKYPDLAPRQIEQLLEKTASNHSAGHNPLTGYGVIDAAKALKAAAAVTPQPAVLPVGKQGAATHFGSGDDGTARTTHQPLDPEYFVLAAIVGVPGLIAILVGLLLLVSRRRARAVPLGS